MFTFLLILTIIIFASLLLVATMKPQPPAYSYSELSRRAAQSHGYRDQLRRADLLVYVEVLLRIITALLLVLTVLLLVVTFDWLAGVIIAVIVAVGYPTLARQRLVHRLGQFIYEQYEPYILRLIERIRPVLNWLRSEASHGIGRPAKVDSYEELIEIIQQSHDALTADQRTLIESALRFGDKRVASVMTPKSVIRSVRKEEFLGPLVLSELHAYGHSRLPVIDGDIDHIVGTLHLRDLLSLDVKRSTTAEKAMEAKVYYIHEDDTLEHALSAFIKVRHHLFVVINDERETVGLLSLEDVMEALIGRRIVDEDDIHADLRAVAKRQSVTNNRSEGHVDL